MTMGIDQTRHEQQTAAVDGLSTFFYDRLDFSYVCDEILFYSHITAKDRLRRSRHQETPIYNYSFIAAHLPPRPFHHANNKPDSADRS
ncbi:hypothetical protein D3C86_1869190 [compost metagenome]